MGILLLLLLLLLARTHDLRIRNTLNEACTLQTNRFISIKPLVTK